MEEDKNTVENDAANARKDAAFDNNVGVDNFDEKSAEQSFFHVTTKYKWILALSILLAAAEGILIYANVMGAVAAEIWQTAIWGVGILLAIYAIVKKSLAAMLFNLVLFLGISLIPAWGMAYEFFRPVIELFTGA